MIVAIAMYKRSVLSNNGVGHARNTKISKQMFENYNSSTVICGKKDIIYSLQNKF
jgi:hypothetical protein